MDAGLERPEGPAPMSPRLGGVREGVVTPPHRRKLVNNAIRAVCPYCKSVEGHPCITRSGRDLRPKYWTFHKARSDEWKIHNARKALDSIDRPLRAFGCTVHEYQNVPCPDECFEGYR